MRDSDTYLAILEEGIEKGREEGIEKGREEVILRLGKRQFGSIEEPMLSQLNGITDLQRLRGIFDRIFDAAGWQDLFDTP